MGAIIDLTLWVVFSAGELSFLLPSILPLRSSYGANFTGLTFAQLQEEHPSTKARLTVLSLDYYARLTSYLFPWLPVTG